MTTQTTSSNASPARFNYVGEPIRFEGYVDDFEHGVAAVQLSLDMGTTWTDFPCNGARTELGLSWNFTYTPQTPGRYQLRARALSRAAEPAMTVESFTFDVLPARAQGSAAVWGSMALRPVGNHSLEDAVLFRSRELTEITPQEAVTLVNVLDIQSVYDIRGAREVAVSPEPALPGVRMLAVEPRDGHKKRDAHARLVHGVIGEYGAPEQRMCDNYRRYASDYPLIGTVLRSIAAQGSPALVHCKNGKDRTGVLCACVLRIAGYSLDYIVADYLTTNAINAQAIEREAADLSCGMTAEERAILMSFLEARESYLEAFFDEAVKRYGSFEAYVLRGLKLTSEQCGRLREMLG